MKPKEIEEKRIEIQEALYKLHSNKMILDHEYNKLEESLFEWYNKEYEALKEDLDRRRDNPCCSCIQHYFTPMEEYCLGPFAKEKRYYIKICSVCKKDCEKPHSYFEYGYHEWMFCNAFEPMCDYKKIEELVFQLWHEYIKSDSSEPFKPETLSREWFLTKFKGD